MEKQEIIEKIAKCICNACEMGDGYEGECSEGGDYKRCGISVGTAEHIYEILINDDFIKSAQKQVIQDFAELLKYKYGYYSCYSFPNIVTTFHEIIDEVLRSTYNGKQI